MEYKAFTVELERFFPEVLVAFKILEKWNQIRDLSKIKKIEVKLVNSKYLGERGLKGRERKVESKEREEK